MQGRRQRYKWRERRKTGSEEDKKEKKRCKVTCTRIGRQVDRKVRYGMGRS